MEGEKEESCGERENGLDWCVAKSNKCSEII
jgi:hypothetical protein